MNTIEQLLERFYNGNIGQAELDALYDAFLHDARVREAWPTDAAVILPLALARADAGHQAGPHEHLSSARPHVRPARPLIRRRRVAAAVLLLLLAGGSVAVIAAGNRPRVYTTDASCDASCAGLWLENTLRSAL